MAEMEVDTLVATLMSLGFDYDGCQQAISEGNTTVEAAVEWLLNRDSVNPNLVQAKEAECVESVKSSESPCHSLNTQSEVKTGEHVVSRYATDEAQKKAQDDFEQRKRYNIQNEAKKRRLVDKQLRQEILQQIKEDRDIARTRRSGGKQENPASQLKTDNTKESHAHTSANLTRNSCRLKIRLTNGKNITEACESNESLLDIITRIKQIYNESGDVDVMQPFPHKKFTEEELQQSLTILGLTPGGCLVLNNSSSTTVELHGRGEEGLQEQGEIEDDYTIGLPGQNMAQPHHVWGPGVSLEHNEEGSDVEEREENDIENHPNIPIPHILQHQHVWGSGESLGRHPYNPHAIDPVIHAESAAEAAEARSRIQIGRHEVNPNIDPVSFPSHDVQSLVDICITDIAKRLPGHYHPVGSLAPLSQRLCMKIIKYLMRKKTLTPKTLKSFVPCVLKQLVLDHYLYVTNELFHTIRLFRSLTYLSVQSCTVFTDKALEAISGLKKIIYLDFSNCTQLTDKCLKHLKTHENLETLKLDNTKVTDDGLCSFFKDLEWRKLYTLSLSKTAVSNRTLATLKGSPQQRETITNLPCQFSLVSELQALMSFTSLIRLNVGGTRITDQSLLCLRNHPSLKNINLHQTHVSDQGLAYFANLKLVELRLPNRLSITDVGISYLEGLLLTSLDLTDYVNITDEALRTVGTMTRLIRLSLAKTKISDSGIQFLSGLISLKELDLERTAVSDNGLDVLSYLVRLEELNLSGTRITDNGLSSGKLNVLGLLCKLNLSRTNITDSGVADLKLPELTLLNLDWTLTTEQCRNLLGGCPQLQALRRQNCQTENSL